LAWLLSLVLHNGNNFDTIMHRLEWRGLDGQCLAFDLPLAVVRRAEPRGRPRRIGDSREFRAINRILPTVCSWLLRQQLLAEPSCWASPSAKCLALGPISDHSDIVYGRS